MSRPPRAAPSVMKMEAIRMGTTGSACERSSFEGKLATENGPSRKKSEMAAVSMQSPSTPEKSVGAEEAAGIVAGTRTEGKKKAGWAAACYNARLSGGSRTERA